MLCSTLKHVSAETNAAESGSNKVLWINTMARVARMDYNTSFVYVPQSNTDLHTRIMEIKYRWRVYLYLKYKLKRFNYLFDALRTRIIIYIRRGHADCSSITRPPRSVIRAVTVCKTVVGVRCKRTSTKTERRPTTTERKETTGKQQNGFRFVFFKFLLRRNVRVIS